MSAARLAAAALLLLLAATATTSAQPAAPTPTPEPKAPSPDRVDAPAPAPAPVDPTAATPADLGWPADTTTVEVTAGAAHVLDAPIRKGKPLGKIMRGTRTGLLGVKRGDRRCKFWVELAPRGWLCATRVAPTTAPPGGEVFPIVAAGEILPGTYYDVGPDGAWAYADKTAARESTEVKELIPGTMLVSRGRVRIDGRVYLDTNKGLVEATQLRGMRPSQWVGLDLRATPITGWPIGLTVGKRRGDVVIVRAAADKKAAEVRRIERRTQVAVAEEVPGWVRIGDGEWLARADVRVITPQPVPDGVPADAQWIDVDLDEQTLIAYQGATPQYLTLVSTGIRRGATPAGLYRIRAKASTTRMAAEADEAKLYDVSAVPWAMRFKAGLYLHAAYWHDAFGVRRSHGCVNLSPRDARALYEWATPVQPPGWSEVEVELPAGVVVRIRDSKKPNPAWFNYARERKQAKPIDP